jgi:hypothetical protein
MTVQVFWVKRIIGETLASWTVAMPVVMTGSPGGGLGGAAGPAFGSGLGRLSSSPKKLFTPNLEVWTQRAAEDESIAKEREVAYKALKESRLAIASERKEQNDSRKTAAKSDFAERQKARLQAEAAEKERMRQFRKESIEKNLKEFARQGEPGYGPTRWCWPTAHDHPRHCSGTGGAGLGTQDVGVELLLGPGNTRVFSPLRKEGEPPSGMASIGSDYQDRLKEMKQRDAEARAAVSQAEADAEADAKADRDAQAMARKQEMKAKAEAAKRVATARSKQIKKEMAEETKKQAREAERLAKIRAEKAQKEREEMIRHLKMDMKLRDEDEIANERREGSSMSKGGKAAFTASAKAKEDMSGY